MSAEMLTSTQWVANTRAMVQAETRDQYADVLVGAADFAERRGLIGERRPINLFGFGTVTSLFCSPDGEWWCPLFDLDGPTGVDAATLLSEYENDHEEFAGRDADEMTWSDSDGQTHQLRLVTCSFAMRILSGHSPWAKEFMANTIGLFRHAMVKSGLADAMGPVLQVNADGTTTETHGTFGDFLAGGDQLPSEEEATARAFAGPTAAIDAAH